MHAQGAHNRFYDAQTGRWLSEDPIKSGLNWYQYCGSNPVSYVDLLGLEEEGMGGVIGSQSGKGSKNDLEPEADVYIFFQLGMYDATEVDNGIFYRKEDYIRYINALKEPFEDQRVKVVLVNDKKEFIQGWNDMPDDNITVVTNLHANPTGYVFEKYEQNEEGIYEVASHEELSSYEILTQLDYKNIETMYNLGCNSYGYHELEELKDCDKETDLLLANALQAHGVKRQLVSKGYVSSRQDETENTVYFGPIYTKILSVEEAIYNGMEAEKNIQGNFYVLKGCKINENDTYISGSESILFSHYKIDTDDYLNAELYSWRFTEIANQINIISE